MWASVAGLEEGAAHQNLPTSPCFSGPAISLGGEAKSSYDPPDTACPILSTCISACSHWLLTSGPSHWLSPSWDTLPQYPYMAPSLPSFRSQSPW